MTVEPFGVITARNVNDAFFKGVNLVRELGMREESRAGHVSVLPFPVVTVYTRPLERVLFSAQRDANPFFHLMEALWMLAGRNDATWLDQFVHDFSARFAEEDGHLHGAYGFRWREHFDLEGGGLPWAPDQLEYCIKLLREDPSSRQVVLTMWDPVADLGAKVKDKPCNTHIYFRIKDRQLDMTVCCRSNDIIWGAYGANAVHMSLLQEYVASCAGCYPGMYFQFSNNYHAYVDALDKIGNNHIEVDWYKADPADRARVVPLVASPVDFAQDLARFMGGDLLWSGSGSKFSNSFFEQVAVPMLWAHQMWKGGNRDQALRTLATMPLNCDWRIAAEAWMKRRMLKKQHQDASTVGDVRDGPTGG